MSRRLLNWGAGLSLALAGAVVAFWVRSGWWQEDAVRLGQGWALVSAAGCVGVVRNPQLFAGGGYVFHNRPEPIMWWPIFHGLSWPVFALPGWLCLCLAMVIPSVWLVAAVRRRRRRDPGLCQACGYDLRGSPPGGACPECGAGPPGAGAAPAP